MYKAGVRRFVIKPTEGSLGAGVLLLQTAQQVLDVLQANPNQAYLLEQHIMGNEFRVYVVDRTPVHAYQVIPNHVLGNGRDTVRTLHAVRFEQRKVNPFFGARDVHYASAEIALLSRGFSWDYIPAVKEIVWLAADQIPDSSSDMLPILPKLSEEARLLAVDAARSVAAFNCAVDMIMDSKGVPYVLEVNIRAYITQHCFPMPSTLYNIDVPTSLIKAHFGSMNTDQRKVTGFDFAALRTNLFQKDQPPQGVRAADFAVFQ